MSHAVLIGPKPADGMTLNLYEYTAARNLVRLNRMEGNKEADVIVRTLHSCEEKDIADFDRVVHFGENLLTYFFKQLMDQVGQLHGGEEVSALFANGWDKPVIMLREDDGDDRANCVLALLKLLEKGSWFGEFLLHFLPAFLTEPRTPLEVMWRLSERAVHFEGDVEDAKRMLREWPELIQPETAKAQEAH